MWLKTLFLLFLCLAAAPAGAAIVIDGMQVQMDDGRVVRLAGITDASAGFLQQWLVGRNVTAREVSHNRHGEALVALVDDKGENAAAALVAAGMALVYTTPDTASMAAELLPLEDKARAAGSGGWRDRYKILTPETAATALNRFAIVEGVPVSVATIKGVTYVNFGADWKTDFTVTMPAALGKQLGATGWVGRTIRVRGWMQSKNGPMMAVTHREQVELIP